MQMRRLAAPCGILAAAVFGFASTRSHASPGFSSGFSGRLRAIFALPGEVPDGVPDRPGVYRLFGSARRTLTCIVLTPFSTKVDGWIGGYRMGAWPFESRAATNPAYESPPGFVEVTPENFATHVSDHFTLGQFVTKGQDDVWPKYLALDPRLLDKLELTLDELVRRGYAVPRFTVMSGFRTPDYNETGGNPAGRSAVSRHLFGDAADVFPDRWGRGWIDDLNRDGRRDIRDARIVAAAAEAVEARHPELSGGIGVYPGVGEHGPFVHIDARGRRARWGG